MEKNSSRFQDQNLRLTDFNQKVAVHCPSCQRKAWATVDYAHAKAKLVCQCCGFFKTVSTSIWFFGKRVPMQVSAHVYFQAKLWYFATFRDDVFWALNDAHLSYLEKYIAAKQRQSNERTHFTLLERLPKFYHEAKNRESLLKLIQKLKKK